MTIYPDDIAQCVLSTFDSLTAKRKPREREDGSREWVPLSGIVLSRDGEPLTCASLGTGMKCLPRSKIPTANGTVLHDWHAEVLAIRAFNRFLLDQCADLAAAGLPCTSIVRRRGDDEISPWSMQPFAIREDVRIHIYCSEAPCGDASMELTMGAQEDATPWPLLKTVSPTNEPDQREDGGLKGRGYFSELGIVRRKPSRPDAPATLSKSCTDKLALKQCTSLLNSTTSLLLSPSTAYLHTLILPASQHVSTATDRAFGPTGRMAVLTPHTTHPWQGSYAYRPFKVKTTTREFTWSRRSGQLDQRMLPSNLSAVYTPQWQETLIGGVLQGRKQFDPRGASRICRRGMWRAAADVASKVGVPALVAAMSRQTYGEIKKDRLLESRRKVEEDVKAAALKGWISNDGDEEFELGEGVSSMNVR